MFDFSSVDQSRQWSKRQTSRAGYPQTTSKRLNYSGLTVKCVSHVKASLDSHQLAGKCTLCWLSVCYVWWRPSATPSTTKPLAPFSPALLARWSSSWSGWFTSSSPATLPFPKDSDPKNLPTGAVWSPWAWWSALCTQEQLPIYTTPIKLAPCANRHVQFNI